MCRKKLWFKEKWFEICAWWSVYKAVVIGQRLQGSSYTAIVMPVLGGEVVKAFHW